MVKIKHLEALCLPVLFSCYELTGVPGGDHVCTGDSKSSIEMTTTVWYTIYVIARTPMKWFQRFNGIRIHGLRVVRAMLCQMINGVLPARLYSTASRASHPQPKGHGFDKSFLKPFCYYLNYKSNCEDHIFLAIWNHLAIFARAHWWRRA